MRIDMRAGAPQFFPVGNQYRRASYKPPTWWIAQEHITPLSMP